MSEIRKNRKKSSGSRTSGQGTRMSSLGTRTSSQGKGKQSNTGATRYTGRSESSEKRNTGYHGQSDSSEKRNTGHHGNSDNTEKRNTGYHGHSESFDKRDTGYRGRNESSEKRNLGYAGKDVRSENRTSRYEGKDTRSENRTSRYEGKDVRSENRNPRYEGKDVRSENRTSRYEDKDTRSVSRNPRYEGKDVRSENRTSRYEGKDVRSENRNPRYEGKDTRSENRHPRFEGKDTRSENRTSRYDGKDVRSENRTSGYDGKDEKYEQRNTGFHGQADKQDNRKYRTSTKKTNTPRYASKSRNTSTDIIKDKVRTSEFSEKAKYLDDDFEDMNYDLLDKNDKGRNNRNSKTSDKTSIRKTYNNINNHAKGACPYSWECGGCNVLQQSYEDELKEKQSKVAKLLNKYCKVEPIVGMEEPSNYRNKVHVVFDHDKKGNPISGVYEEGSHRVVPIDKCLIHNQKADAIIATIRGMLKSFKILTFDEDTGYGLLRHVLIRTGYASGEIMVVLVLSSPILPSKNNFVKALREEHPEITTVVINVNDKRTSMVLGDKEQVIYGKGFIEDSLCEKVFRISPKSFYQVNPAVAEAIYKKAIEMAGLTGSETVIDAYCGTGTIGIIASDYVNKVIGVELNKDAVRDANINAKRNEAHNIEFYKNDAGVFMSQMAVQTEKETVDVVFMDPPRTGSNEQFMDALAQLKPNKVVYISCNPVTLERDLQYLTKKGYKAEKAVPFDMFPWTGHVESIVLLSRKNN